MYASRLRVAAAARELLPRHLPKKPAPTAAALLSTTARQLKDYQQQQSPSAPTTTAGPASQAGVPDQPAPPPTAAILQAPNRAEVWSRSQRPREVAMTGPRFEQTDFELQVGFNIEPEGLRRGIRVNKDEGRLIMNSWLLAPTVRRHRAHPPAAGAVDARPDRGV
jgi:hypothetical protein